MPVAAYEPGVSCVVVNYRTPRDLGEFVDSYVFQESAIDSELIIIDVDPTEQSYEESRNILSRHNFGFQYWPFQENVGYGRACNFGSALAAKDVIAFFNADTSLLDDTLQLCHQGLIERPNAAILGPLQINKVGRVTNAGIFGTNQKPEIRGWKSRHPEKFRDIREDCVSVMGSAYFANHRIWDEMTNHLQYQKLFPGIEGAFLPTPHYYEETWVSYFARHLGYDVIYFGEAMMHHEWHQASKIGDVERRFMPHSRKLFQETCDVFGIAHD